MKIPKLIHFIWAGGTKLLPEKNIEIIKRWAELHPDFEINIWIDKESYIKETCLALGITNPNKIFAEKLIAELMDTYQSKFKNIKNKLVFRDVEEEKVVSKAARYEMDRLDPNYGASSDMIRYQVLAKYGGFYFDSDVAPNPKLSLASWENIHEECLALDKNSQNSGATGNDAIACTPHHPFMLTLAKKSSANYHSEKISQKFIYDVFDLFDRSLFHKRDATIEMTGPALIQNLGSKNIVVEDLQKYVAHEQKNEANWLKAPLKKIKNPEDALIVIFNSILFEAQSMKVFRGDHHIQVLAKCLNIDEAKASQMLIGFLTQKIKEDKEFFLLLQNVFCQLNFIHPELINFYQIAKINLDRTGLLPGKLLADISIYDFFCHVFHLSYFKEKSDLEEYDQSDPQLQLLLASLPEEKACIDSAFCIIEFLAKELKLVKFDQAEVEYLDGLNDAMIDFISVLQTTNYGKKKLAEKGALIKDFNDFLTHQSEKILQRNQLD